MLATLITGYVDLADWLWLFAAIAFIIAGLIAVSGRPDPTRGALVPFGLALAAIAWLVL